MCFAEVTWNFGSKKDSRGSIEVSGMYNSLKWLYLSPHVTCQVDVLFICFYVFVSKKELLTMEAIDEPHIQLVSSEEHNVSGGCRGTYPFWCTWWMFAIRCWQCSCSRINDAGMFDQLTISVTPFLMANSHRSFITLLIAICSPQNCYLWMLIPPNMVNYSNYR